LFQTDMSVGIFQSCHAFLEKYYNPLLQPQFSEIIELLVLLSKKRNHHTDISKINPNFPKLRYVYGIKLIIESHAQKPFPSYNV